MIFIYIYIDISLLCEPNDAVRAVAVAKRREYAEGHSFIHRLSFDESRNALETSCNYGAAPRSFCVSSSRMVASAPLECPGYQIIPRWKP